MIFVALKKLKSQRHHVKPLHRILIMEVTECPHCGGSLFPYDEIKECYICSEQQPESELIHVDVLGESLCSGCYNDPKYEPFLI